MTIKRNHVVAAVHKHNMCKTLPSHDDKKAVGYTHIYQSAISTGATLALPIFYYTGKD